MGNDKANATLYASTGLPVSQMTGEASGQSPSRCSVNVVTPVAGKNEGKFHQRSVSGVTVAFQCRIAALSSGSPRSIGNAVSGAPRSRMSRAAVQRMRNAAVAENSAANPQRRTPHHTSRRRTIDVFLVRYAVEQRVQSSRWQPHNGLD